MKRYRLIAMTLAVALSFSLVACDVSQVQKVKTATATIERLVTSASALLPAFEDEGLFDAGEREKIQSALGDVTAALHEFNQRAASYKTFDVKAKADLARAFVDVTNALSKLNDQGVLHVKNPKVKARLQVALVAANLAAQEIAAALAN